MEFLLLEFLEWLFVTVTCIGMFFLGKTIGYDKGWEAGSESQILLNDDAYSEDSD